MSTPTATTAPMPEARTRARIGPVAANPYPWPFDGSVDAARTALICIDWQVDFCGPGGYVDRMGYDIGLTRAGLPATAAMLAHARGTGMLVVHTREGHAPDLSDLPANKRWRSARIGAEIGSIGPTGRILVRGEPGWEIVPEVAPIPGEVLLDKPGKGAFYATNLDLVLRTISIGCGSFGGTSCGPRDGVVEVAGLVDALLLAVEVVAPVVGEVAVAV